MKVLYLIDTLEIGGAEQSLLNILQRFRSVEPIVCHVYQGAHLKSAYENAGIPVISLDIEARYAFPTAVRRVLEVVRTQRPDILHTTLFRSDIVGRTVGRLTGIPVISSFINEPYHADRWVSLSLSGKMKLKGVQWMDRLTARWAAHFVAVSKPTRLANSQSLGISPDAVTVIYRGREPGKFLDVQEGHCEVLRAALGIRSDVPVVVNVARLLQRKGQAELIDAIPIVLKRFPEAQLFIAGEGHDRRFLQAKIDFLNINRTVHLLGSRNDIPQLLHIADVFVFPSHYEGHPGALIEAMLTATPVVASDIPVHADTLLDGELGVLVPVRDSDKLAQAIEQLLSNRSAAIERALCARESALQRFDIEQISAQHEALYAKISKA